MLAFADLLLARRSLWRRKPELHRRLLFIATCGLLDAAFGRFDYLYLHGLFFPCLDGVILLGVLRDVLVNRRVHRVYINALPGLFTVQAVVTYTWMSSSTWWVKLAHSILGV